MTNRNKAAATLSHWEPPADKQHSCIDGKARNKAHPQKSKFSKAGQRCERLQHWSMVAW